MSKNLLSAAAIGAAVLTAVPGASFAENAPSTALDRFVAFTGPTSIVGTDGVPIATTVTILVDKTTGRSWKLSDEKTGTRWTPIHFFSAQMADEGTPPKGGTLVPADPVPVWTGDDP